MSDQKEDQEFQSVSAIAKALRPLADEARERVLSAALALLGIAQRAPAATGNESQDELADGPPSDRPAIPDIRSLRDNKAPKSDIEMAVLVAYYLQYVVPTNERRDTITAEDIEEYFRQADHPLPSRGGRDVLPNAKRAGYFDLAAPGSYRLNPVGHNLAAHGLPRSASDQRPSRSGPKSRGRKKPSRKAAAKTRARPARK